MYWLYIFIYPRYRLDHLKHLCEEELVTRVEVRLLAWALSFSNRLHLVENPRFICHVGGSGPSMKIPWQYILFRNDEVTTNKHWVVSTARKKNWVSYFKFTPFWSDFNLFPTKQFWTPSIVSYFFSNGSYLSVLFSTVYGPLVIGYTSWSTNGLHSL